MVYRHRYTVSVITDIIAASRVKPDNDRRSACHARRAFSRAGRARVRHAVILCHTVFFPRSIEKDLLIGKEVHYNATFPRKCTQPRSAETLCYLC